MCIRDRLEVESAALTRQLNELANANTIDFSAIRDLESALASEVPPDLEDLQAVYQEAGVVLPGLVKRRYEDVKSFHESVVRNRKDYLSSELEAAKLRIELRDGKKAQLDQRRGEVLDILKSHGALEQFLKLQGELGRLESEVAVSYTHLDVYKRQAVPLAAPAEPALKPNQPTHRSDAPTIVRVIECGMKASLPRPIRLPTI